MDKNDSFVSHHNPREKTFQALEHYRQQEEILRASIALDYSDADPLRMVNNMTLQQAADKLSEVMVERMQLEDELDRESETVVSAMKAMTYDGVGQHKGRDSTALLNKVAVAASPAIASLVYDPLSLTLRYRTPSNVVPNAKTQKRHEKHAVKESRPNIPIAGLEGSDYLACDYVKSSDGTQCCLQTAVRQQALSSSSTATWYSPKDMVFNGDAFCTRLFQHTQRKCLGEMILYVDKAENKIFGHSAHLIVHPGYISREEEREAYELLVYLVVEYILAHHALMRLEVYSRMSSDQPCLSFEVHKAETRVSEFVAITYPSGFVQTIET